MDTNDDKAKGRYVDRNVHAAEVLRRLDEIGAIKLEVLVSKSAEIKSIISSGGGSGAGSAAELDPEDRICYPFMIRIGPRHDIDLVTVSNELRQLGFEIKRVGTQTKG